MLAANKEVLIDSEGRSYRDFRVALTPRYSLVVGQLLAGHLALLIVATLLIISEVFFSNLFIVSGVVGAVAIGYGLAYLSLFFHEAAHFNLMPDRKANDLIAQLLIGSLIAQHIVNYRKIHFDHHRFLGTPDDPEPTYFEPLTPWFVVESLFLVRAVRVVFLRGKRLTLRDDDPKTRKRLLGAVVASVFIHSSVVISAFYAEYFSLAIAWLLGVITFFPFFASIRQVLEHRPVQEGSAEYRDGGMATTRMFGSGVFGSTFGAAGFNRHFLHHWEPQVPCTRLRELEQFLSQTELEPAVRERLCSYKKTFVALFKI